MARLGVPLLLLLLGLVVGGAAAATAPPDSQAACEPTNLATQIALFCAPDMPTAPCCEPVVASVDLGGGVPCLCRVAAQPQLILARLNATHLLSLYAACGGLRTGGAHIAAACQGPSPPAVGPAPPAVPVIPPPPPAAPRHKLPSREAPPPPARAKPSPPPQQQSGGAAQGKAVPALPATPNSEVPAAAPVPPSSTNSGSESPTGFRAYWILIALAVIIILE
ncbi:hypothetical protein QOZ80_4AG0316560 [Eleusine coracana subsp. coracana]|nr:hypothetical protein QOZ80_4AG0316560 [Eleusine coracana subsp. coracana]